MFLVSFFTSMGGVSGAFLLLPIQMSLFGFTTPSVTSTNQLYNIISIPSGVYRYIIEGRMIWQLTLIILAGSIPGIVLGSIIRVIYLPDPQIFKFFVGLVLMYLGVKIIIDFSKDKSKISNKPNKEIPKVDITLSTIRKLKYRFGEEEYIVPVVSVTILSLIIGVIGGIYGIGGGAILAPILVSLYKLPVYTIAGATLMSTFVSSITAVFTFQILSIFFKTQNISPDWLLGFLFGIGGFLGIYCGARFQKYFPSKLIKFIIFICVTLVALKYILAYF